MCTIREVVLAKINAPNCRVYGTTHDGQPIVPQTENPTIALLSGRYEKIMKQWCGETSLEGWGSTAESLMKELMTLNSDNSSTIIRVRLNTQSFTAL